MPYQLVKGEFHLFYNNERHVGSRPDGDSMWFKPDNPAELANIGGRNVEYNKGGMVQLRFEGIDALELHYKGKHQHLELSKASRDFTLKDGAGFDEIEYAPETFTSVRTADPHPIRGYILTRNVDPYGRPVSFVFAGDTEKQSGKEHRLEIPWMNESINAGLARTGNAYPAFYRDLPWDLRGRLAELSVGAQEPPAQNTWTKDESEKGFKAATLDDLEKLAIWPKLFRRLVTFFKYKKEKNEVAELDDFKDWLRDTDKDDDLWIISRGEYGNMHDVFKCKNNKLHMVFPPRDIVVVPG